MSWLVVGLGNPGSKYSRNRHNIGFMVVDELAQKHGLPAWSTKLGGEVTAGIVTTSPAGQESGGRGSMTRGRGRERATLLKPMEFMNLSGFAVQRVAAFHKVDVDNILVVHDELDLEFGIVRLKSGGGHGGHNGLRSMIEQLGSNGFARLRMGIGRDPNAKPGAKDAAGWVLSDFPSAQGDALTRVLRAGCEDVECVLAKGIKDAMNQHNARSNVATP
ncbi:MAG: aminoacyl-tRNA hydrolase [Kofleriaceae bacterium]|nr:aminoacyl-tRNA hydrolase [Kofleriaceae bacterium]